MIRLALRVAHADAELVLAELLELVPGGVEEIELPATDGGEDIVEYAVYGAPGELPELPDLRAAAGGALVEISTAEIPDDWSERWKRFHRPVLVEGPVANHRSEGEPAPALGVCEAEGQRDGEVGEGRGAGGAGEGRGSGEVGEGDGEGDGEGGKDRGSGEVGDGDGDGDGGGAGESGEVGHGGEGEGEGEGGDACTKAVPRARVGPSLFVRPPWEASSERPGALDIVIDPAQAFGTGAHATTRLCLELLLELTATDDTRGAVLDVGTGSGVLAISAAKLGYGPILALDNDRESVLATVANATANGVHLDTRHFDLRREELPQIDGAQAPLVLANLLGPLLHDLADTISSPPRHLVASGLLCAEADGVASAFAVRHGLRERRRLQRGEWAALWLTRD